MVKSYIPKNKEDLFFVEELKKKHISEIEDDISELLEWLQDGNWPQAPYVADYFRPYVNKIKKEIIEILRSDDEMWKYWIINGLLYPSEFAPDESILFELKRLSETPSINEKEAEVDVAAIDVLEKFVYN